MSIIHPNTIKAIAQSVDIPKLSDEAAKTLAPDVEYRLREVVQEALKFAKHAKRTKLTTEDINDALRLRNVEPLYGFGSRDPAKFLRVATHPELMYVKDTELSYHELIETPLPKLPREAGVAVHWLAINGVQPDLPENTPIEQLPAKRQRLSMQRPAAGQEGLPAASAPAGPESHLGLAAQSSTAAAAAGGGAAANAAAAAAAGAAGAGQRAPPGQAANPRAAAATASVQLQLPLRHAVSRELQVYFDKIVGLLLTPPPAPAPATAGGLGSTAGISGGGGRGGHSCRGAAAGAAEKHVALLRGAYASVSADPGLHPLVPYFSAFIADGVVQHLGELWLLERMLQLARALLANPAVHLERYLQQLLPAVVTCLVTRTLGGHPLEDHWGLRRQAGALLAALAAQFSAPHHNLVPRLCRVLVQAFLDPSKYLTSKYGAVVGLQALGPQVVRTLLIPHLEPFMSSSLFPAMASEPADAHGSSSSKAGQQQQQSEAGNSSTSANSSVQDQQRRRTEQAQRQQQRVDAWQVYGVLLSAVGAAVYDRLVGQLQGELPMHLLLARRSRPDVDWGSEYTQALLVAKQPVAVQMAAQADSQQGKVQLQVADGNGAATADGAAAAAAAEAAANGVAASSGEGGAAADAAEAGPSSSGKPQYIQQRALIGASSAAAAARMRTVAGGGSCSSSKARPGQQQQQQQQQRPSVAEVLGDSWKEDSDVNGTLGALLLLFGEDLLPCLPLAQLAAVSL